MKGIRQRLCAAVCIGLLGLTACGGDPVSGLSPEAAQGREIANSVGCSSCHGKNGQGAAGPAWKGLYLSTVELDDDRTVLADDHYLYSSITDPQAAVVRGWTIEMPSNDLDDDQIAAIIAYIKELQ